MLGCVVEALFLVVGNGIVVAVYLLVVLLLFGCLLLSLEVWVLLRLLLGSLWSVDVVLVLCCCWRCLVLCVLIDVC